MTNPQPQPCPCYEGHTPRVEIFDDSEKFFFVDCIMADCWTGPVMDSKQEAIAAWNRAMSKRRKK